MPSLQIWRLQLSQNPTILKSNNLKIQKSYNPTNSLKFPTSVKIYFCLDI